MSFQPLLFSGFVLGQSSGGGGSSPTIGGPITGGTDKSVLFVHPNGTISQDNSNFNYDPASHALTITGVFSASNVSGNNTGNVTIGTANGLSLVGQILSIQLASASQNGALSNTDWSTFNNKQPALNFTSPLFNTANTITIQVANTSQSGYLSNTDWNTFNNKQAAGSYVLTSQIGAANGVASLDSGSKIPIAQLPSSVMIFLGNWNASTNTPTLADGTGVNGDVYRASVAGTQNLGSGPQTWAIGDLVIYNGSIWQHAPAADGVSSVNTFTGAVVLTQGNLTESSSSVLTISGGTNAVWGSGTSIQVTQSTTSTSGYLSNTDWNTFNNKQSTLTLGNLTASATFSVTNGTGAVVGSGTSIAFASQSANTFLAAPNGSSGVPTARLIVPADIPTLNQNTTGTASNVTGVVAIVNGGTNSSTSLSNNKVMVSTGGSIIESATTTTQLGFLDATSSIQTQLNARPLASSGDINETSFSAANNQSSASNVTGFAFANGTVRSFQALVSVFINATGSLYEVFDLNGIQRGSDWQMSASSTGDSSGIVFSITTSGQIQYTSTNITGFSSDTMKFRAWTTSV